MATYTENLIIVRDQIAAALVDMTANPKPNYTIGDETYAWGDLFEKYTQQLKELTAAIVAGQPFEFRTRRIVR